MKTKKEAIFWGIVGLLMASLFFFAMGLYLYKGEHMKNIIITLKGFNGMDLIGYCFFYYSSDLLLQVDDYNSR